MELLRAAKYIEQFYILLNDKFYLLTTLTSCVFFCSLTAPDHTPGLGLFWYLFAEMFDHFRDFFLWVFQFNIVIYAVPLALRFRYKQTNHGNISEIIKMIFFC